MHQTHVRPPWFRCRSSEGRTVSVSHAFSERTFDADYNASRSFANVDFAVVSGTQRWFPLLRHVQSYDIICQYIIWLYKRLKHMAGIAGEFKTIQADAILQYIEKLPVAMCPKYHSAAHKRECRYKFNPEFIAGTGRTDGEAPERIWSDENGIALRGREMGKAMRRDTYNAYNDYKNYERRSTVCEHPEDSIRREY